MPNTIVTGNFQKHVRANAPYRTNTFTEQSERIVGKSARLRGFDFVSETATDVTLDVGDFFSATHVLDLSQPTRTSGIAVRLLAQTVVDITGLTNPKIFALVEDAIEDAANPVTFVSLEGTDPDPDSRHAPLIFRQGGTWFQYQAIGNDELGSAGILASGSGTVPAGINSTITITHNLGLGAYRVLLQAKNLSDPVYTIDGLTTPTQVGELWAQNILANSFDVNSDSAPAVDFDWAVIR